MSLQYENRRGQIYHLQLGKTPTGKPKYYMGRKITGTPLDVVPEGHEIYESPQHGQVFVRKIKPSAITPFERAQAADLIRRTSGLEHVIVDVEENSLVVWTPSIDVSTADDLIRHLAGDRASSMAGVFRQAMLKQSPFTKMLRFTLSNPERRLFTAERWCFRGSIDDWIFIGGPAPLADQIEKCAKGLGSEDFFELI
jgi:hypothetical protein